MGLEDGFVGRILVAFVRKVSESLFSFSICCDGILGEFLQSRLFAVVVNPNEQQFDGK